MPDQLYRAHLHSALDPPYRVIDKITRDTLLRILDREGCNLALDPASGELVDAQLLDLEDNMVMKAQRGSSSVETRVRCLQVVACRLQQYYWLSNGAALHQATDYCLSYLPLCSSHNAKPCIADAR